MSKVILFREQSHRGRVIVACKKHVDDITMLTEEERKQYMDDVSHVAEITVTPNFWWYNLCGALWGLSIVIPGITSSSFMMALGLYQPMMDGLARMDLLVLSACLPGMILAILLLARFVTWFLRTHYSVAFHGILGIVLASTLVIVPTEYRGPGEMLLSAVCCMLGFLLAFLLARLNKKMK